MYEKGSGVAMDIEKAREWYGKTAGNGDADAREALERLNAAFPQTPPDQPEGVPVWKLLTPPPLSLAISRQACGARTCYTIR